MTSACVQNGDNRSPQAMSLRSSWWDRCYEQKEHFHLPCEMRVSNLIMTQRHTLQILRQSLKAREETYPGSVFFWVTPFFLDTVANGCSFGKHLWCPLTCVLWLSRHLMIYFFKIHYFPRDSNKIDTTGNFKNSNEIFEVLQKLSWQAITLTFQSLQLTQVKQKVFEPLTD